MRSSGQQVQRRVLPDAAEAVGVEEGFVGDNREILGLSLGDEHSIERVFVRTGKESRANAVLDGNGKELKAFALKVACEIGHQGGCRGKFAEADFGGNFPGGKFFGRQRLEKLRSDMQLAFQ